MKIFRVILHELQRNVTQADKDLFSYCETSTEIEPVGLYKGGKVLFIGTEQECWAYKEEKCYSYDMPTF